MPALFVREYGIAAKSSDAQALAVGVEGARFAVRMGLSSTAARSPAFGAGTRFVRVWASHDALLGFGEQATVSTDTEEADVVPIRGGRWEFFGVHPGHRLACVLMPPGFMGENVDTMSALLQRLDRIICALLIMLNMRRAEDLDG